MSYYYLSTIHRNYCVREAFKASVSLETGQTTTLLLLFTESRIEGWCIEEEFNKKVFQEELNCLPRNVIKLPPRHPTEDCFMLVEAGQVHIACISRGRVCVKYHAKLTGKKDVNSFDVLIVTEKNGEGFNLVIGDKTAQLTVIKVCSKEYDWVILGSFNVYLDNVVHDLFSTHTFPRETGIFSLYALVGSYDKPSHVAHIEIDHQSREKASSNDLKDVALKSREASETFQERLFKMFDLGNKTLVLFCSHSMK